MIMDVENILLDMLSVQWVSSLQIITLQNKDEHNFETKDSSQKFSLKSLLNTSTRWD